LAGSIAAPTGFEVAGATWIEIKRADGHTQQAAIFTPAGAGPFPTVVYLHGASGLNVPELQWAARLANAGFLVVAGCYLARSDFANFPSIYLPCEDIAPNDLSNSRAIAEGYTALVQTALGLDQARKGPIGIVGVSFGAEVALNADGANTAAVVADSGHGDGEPAAQGPPVLVLGSTGDPMVPHEEVVAYEDSLRAAGRSVDSHYYESNAHVVTVFGDPGDTADATNRAVAFLHQHLM
jgi:dienelactone hydrolase